MADISKEAGGADALDARSEPSILVAGGVGRRHVLAADVGP